MTLDTHNMTPDELVDRWNSAEDPSQILKEIFSHFGARAAIASSGQMTDVAIVDLAHKSGEKIRVYTIDPLRLHESTYDLNLRLEEHYDIELEVFQPDEEALEKMVARHGTYLFFDSREKQELCCTLRKVEPNERALETLDCWITGLRRDQSTARANMPLCEMIQVDGRNVVKVSPLAAWSEELVWDYVKNNGVPYDSLFEPNPDGSRYRSLGCVICTTPELPHEPVRAGRWRWFNANENENKKECGLHLG
jgi:phosphoadenosine phosphosulfate reductase